MVIKRSSFLIAPVAESLDIATVFGLGVEQIPVVDDNDEPVLGDNGKPTYVDGKRAARPVVHKGSVSSETVDALAFYSVPDMATSGKSPLVYYRQLAPFMWVSDMWPALAQLALNAAADNGISVGDLADLYLREPLMRIGTTAMRFVDPAAYRQLGSANINPVDAIAIVNDPAAYIAATVKTAVDAVNDTNANDKVVAETTATATAMAQHRVAEAKRLLAGCRIVKTAIETLIGHTAAVIKANGGWTQPKKGQKFDSRNGSNYRYLKLVLRLRRIYNAGIKYGSPSQTEREEAIAGRNSGRKSSAKAAAELNEAKANEAKAREELLATHLGMYNAYNAIKSTTARKQFMAVLPADIKTALETLAATEPAADNNNPAA